MTVTYSLDVAKTRFCGFAKLLARWKGSIYKILWKEFLVFCFGYALISIIYRKCLTGEQREVFEKVVLFVEAFTDVIPLSFVLGFYVSLVVGRWWTQYEAIPWPDRLCLLIASYVHGADERSRTIRRTLGRYLILLQALAFQAVSTAVKRRFPTAQHLVAAGIMTKEERTVYDKVNFVYGKWWLPCQWFSSLLMRAKKEGRIKDSIMLDRLFQELLTYRNACGTMLGYDWISVPLVYTQVVTLATYMYALALMVGRQYLDTSKDYSKHQVDLYVPLFTLIQFFFYVGWLKVAEQIVNPYGEDDDDFELNWCLDRTVHVVYLIVDHLQTKHPKISRDYFWDEIEPKLPQTKQSAKGIENIQQGSAFSLDVEDAKYLPMDTFLEEDKEENIYSSDSVRRKSLDGYRSSFIRRVLSSGFGQSLVGKQISRSGTIKSSNSRAFTNQGYISDQDKTECRCQSGLSTPAASRKSSFRSFTKRSSPAHSRASSISFRRNKFRNYDLQETEKAQQNGMAADINENGQNAKIIGISSTENESTGEGKTWEQESDGGGQKLDNLMPPIPEEPSRVASFDSMKSIELEGDEAPSEMDDVHNLVKEASEVLKELNRTLVVQGHTHDCELKGYESCCSLNSDSDSESEIDANINGVQSDDFTVVIGEKR